MQLLERFRTAALAAAVLGVAAVGAQAGSLVLSSSGWTASWDDSLDSVLSLAVDQDTPTESNSVIIEKSIRFTTDHVDDGQVNPAKIVFQQTDANAKRLIIVADETVTNDTGLNWNGFRFTVLDGTTGTNADSRFDPVATGIGLPGGFDVSPFTSATFSQNDQILELGGGALPDGQTWTPGQGVDAGELVIIGLPSNGGSTLRSFSFVEQPLTPGGGPPPVIPIPAAMWTGLSGLVGVGLLRRRLVRAN